jgi:hypothetical protein
VQASIIGVADIDAPRGAFEIEGKINVSIFLELVNLIIRECIFKDAFNVFARDVRMIFDFDRPEIAANANARSLALQQMNVRGALFFDQLDKPVSLTSLISPTSRRGSCSMVECSPRGVKYGMPSKLDSVIQVLRSSFK